MRISLNWLAEYVDVTLPPRELAHKLTMVGLEVERVERLGGDWDDDLVRVGLVLSVDAHPNADRLRLATVDYGGDAPQTVVCGAPNVAAGQKIAFARAGAELIDGHSGKPSVLKPAKIRGVESAGMVCSERELGLSQEHEGILVLPEDAPVGTPLAQLLGDTILHIDLKPNRGDCLSMVGVAREVAAITGAELRMPEHTYEEADEPASGRATVRIDDTDLCSRYVGAVIEGVKLGPSPGWMQERLIAAGMRPIANVVDITNYVMLELGQPLHAFDFDAVKQSTIVVRRARPGEKLTTLDGVDRELTQDTLLIADAEQPVAIAGVMGGLDSEVTDRTKTILLESATFDPVSVRRTATRLKNRTEASSRFDKGLNPELAMLAAQRATKLLVELAGGRALHGFADAYPEKALEIHLDVARRRLEQVLGIDLPTSQVRHALTSLGFGCQWDPPDHYRVRVPYWRMDVRIQDDVAEEVARIVGYEEIPTKGLGGDVPPAIIEPRRELRERLRDALVAAGMQEAITYSLTTIESLAQVVPPEDLAVYPPVRIANPVSAEHEYLRMTLRANVLEAIAANVRRHEGELAMFEAARAFVTEEEGRQPLEQEHIAGAVTGHREDRWGHPSGDAVDFFDAKGYVEAALGAVGLEASFEPATAFGFVPGRVAEVQVDGRVVGTVGHVDPAVARHFEIEQEVFLFELIVDEIVSAVPDRPVYHPFTRFPPVIQDIALVVDAATPAENVRSAIAAHDLVRAVRLFDVYEGDRIPAGKKSLAYSVTYQSDEHTLTDEEVAKAQHAILARLKNELNAELRG